MQLDANGAARWWNLNSRKHRPVPVSQGRCLGQQLPAGRSLAGGGKYGAWQLSYSTGGSEGLGHYRPCSARPEASSGSTGQRTIVGQSSGGAAARRAVFGSLHCNHSEGLAANLQL